MKHSLARSSDVSLVRRVAQGDENAACELFEAYADAVLRFVVRRIGEQIEDAEEITQDTFVSAISLASTYDGSCSVSTWLLSIAKLRIVDFMRRRGRDKRIPPHNLLSFDDERLNAVEVSPIDDVISRIDAARLVDKIAASLPADEREVLLLRYVEQLSVREISVLMRRTEKVIQHLISRARKNAARVAAKCMDL